MTSPRRLAAVLVLLLTLTACIDSFGPWLSADGERVSNGQVLQFRGFKQCDQRSVIFMQFFGRQYAKDANGALGQILSEDGEGRVLEFAELEESPGTATPTGITFEGQEILVSEPDHEDYLFISLPEGIVEQWPRYEERCHT